MLFFLSSLYLAAVIIQPAEWIAIFGGKPVQEMIILLSFMVAALFHSERFKEVIFCLPSKVFLAFLFILVLSSAGEGQAYAFNFIGITFFKIYLGFILILVANDTQERLSKTFGVIVLSGLLVSYHCINLYHFDVQIGHDIGETAHVLNWRGSVQWLGTFAGTNTTALMLLLPLSLSLGFLLEQDSFIKKIFFTFTTIVIVYAFYLTHSRGGFIGFMLILAYFFYVKTKIKLKYYVPISLILLVAVVALKPQEEGRGLGESSTPERIELLYQGIQMFKQNPVLGVGAGQFARSNPIHKTAHNIYLNTLAETGFIGMFIFILLYYLPIREIVNHKTILENKMAASTSSENDPAPKTMTSGVNQQDEPNSAVALRNINMMLMALMGFLGAAFFLTDVMKFHILLWP